jgi:hypothetical protein
MPWNLSKPAAGGDRWPKDDHLDHLHVFAGDLERREMGSGEDAYSVAHVDYVICVDCPGVWPDQLVSGKALVPRLTGDPTAELVLGRLGQGLAKPGRSAPWTLDDPTDKDLVTAEAFLDRYATRLPSGTLAVDVKAIEGADHDPDDDDPI